MKFNELGISTGMQKALVDMGFDEASEIQEKAIPEILAGRDVIGQSQTGTGKTGAFLIPVIEQIDLDDRNVQAIVLCPTRELALQVAGEARKFLKYAQGVKTTAIYGGTDIERQIRELKDKPQIIIGTPGRVMDHMRRKTLKLGGVKFVILDEADEMLNMGFEEDIQTILDDIPSRQTILFSATMPQRILNLTKKYQNDPELIKVTPKQLVVPNIEQIGFQTNEKMKMQILGRLLKINDFNSSVIFCNTKRKVEDITENLRSDGFSVECIHGDMRQQQRDRVMKKFKMGEVGTLVATDVAARGIDVENLDAVINFDLPQEDEYYVHRIGRTGRNGKSGVAYTFIGSRDKLKLRDIENYAHTKLKIQDVPSEKEMSNIDNKKKVAKISKAIEEFSEEDNQVVNELLEKYSPENVAKVLYSMLYPKKQYEYKDIPEETRFENRARRTERKESRRGFERGSERSSERGFERRNDRSRKAEPGMVRIFVNVGKMDKITPKDIVGSITANAAIDGKSIGKVDIMDKFSFIELPKEKATTVISKMMNQQIKGRDVNLEIAKK